MKSKVVNGLALVVLAVVLFGVAATKMFGTTVSHKFNAANDRVESHVTFGGPSEYRAAPPRRVRAPRPRVADKATPAVTGVPAEPAEFETVTEVDSTSTFAIDVDTGSFTLARRYLEGGAMPDPKSVRAEEFVNYFRYDYERPPSDRTAAVHFEGAPNPFATERDRYVMSIGLQARSLVERPPVHLTFLVDTSGSMQTHDRLPLAVNAIKTAARQLEPSDTVAIVTYSGASTTALQPTSVRRIGEIDRAADGLAAGGGTAMGSGMEAAYRLAAQHAGPNRVSRVVVMSDGDANIGSRSPSEILASIRASAGEGVTLSTVGFGMGNYRDDMMEQLADAGNGNYVYVDDAQEMEAVFTDRLESMLHVVAGDVKVQVEFDPRYVRSWRQLGYRNRQMADRDFRNDAADAGELGAGHQATALYELTLAPGTSPNAKLATVRFRHKPVGEWEATEAEFAVTTERFHDRIGDASNDLRFQTAVAAFAETLRGRRGVSWGWIEEVAESSVAGRAERTRFVDLVRRAGRVDRRM